MASIISSTSDVVEVAHQDPEFEAVWLSINPDTVVEPAKCPLISEISLEGNTCGFDPGQVGPSSDNDGDIHGGQGIRDDSGLKSTAPPLESRSKNWKQDSMYIWIGASIGFGFMIMLALFVLVSCSGILHCMRYRKERKERKARHDEEDRGVEGEQAHGTAVGRQAEVESKEQPIPSVPTYPP
jgi:hypothetical protein